jgi:glycosyltransferase involved in cell wall biosynthesis
VPTVTVVVPAYNEADRIGPTLQRLHESAAELGILEVIVVDDGSTDRTVAVVEEYVRAPAPTIRLVALAENQGKGAAVRRGVREASGPYVVFLDADLSAPPDAIPRAVAALTDGADIAIGSRVAPDGTDARRSQPLRRRVSGRAFSSLQRLIVGLPYADTQCPFKLFSREAAEQTFPLVETSGWAFDVELLGHARRLGLTIAEFPVAWHHVGGSQLRVGPLTAFRVLTELVSIRRRIGRAPVQLQG